MYSFHHVTLSVRDVDESEKFYSLLGFKKIYEWKAEDKSLKIVHLKNGDAILELFCYSSPKELPESSKELETDLPELGIKHFALNVLSIDKAKEDLDKKNVHIHTKITDGRVVTKYFFIKDPDGILVEVVQDDRNL